MSAATENTDTLRACLTEAQKLEKDLFRSFPVQQRYEFRASFLQFLRGMD